MVERDYDLPSSEDLVRAAHENLTRPLSDATQPTSDVDVGPSVPRPAREDTDESERRGDPVTPTPRDRDGPGSTDATPVEYREAHADESSVPEPPPKEKPRWGLAWIAAGEVIADSVERITDWAPEWIGDLFD